MGRCCLADQPDKDARTEAPTAKRRRDSAAKGETLQSRELGTALVAGAGVVWVMTGAAALIAVCRETMRDGLALVHPLAIDPAIQVARVTRGLTAPLLVFAALVIAGAVAGPMLTAPHFSASAFAPKPGRLNPLAGLQRMFGAHALVELGKALAKAILIFGAGVAVIGSAVPGLLALGAADPEAAAARVGGTVTALLCALGVALAVIAAVDLPIQWLRYVAKLRMSKQEVKEESRESDGAPETKAAQRRMARLAAKRTLAPAMATASVVVVNPAHFAVALRYVPGRDAAPVVVAKGRDIMAEAIRDLAADRHVPVLRYPELTRAIYFTAAVGAPIKDSLYAAVAAVLAFVFSLDQTERDQPDVDVPDTLRYDEDGRR